MRCQTSDFHRQCYIGMHSLRNMSNYEYNSNYWISLITVYYSAYNTEYRFTYIAYRVCDSQCKVVPCINQYCKTPDYNYINLS